MKKMLMTGVTTMGCNAVKRQKRIRRWDLPETIVALLRRHGWEVDWRPVPTGTYPSRTDVVVVNLGTNPAAKGAPYALGALWAVYLALVRCIPLVILLEDAQLNRVASGFRYFAKHGARQIMKRLGDQPMYADADAAITHADALIGIAHEFGDPGSDLWRHAVPVVPRFRGWGDPAIIRRKCAALPEIAEIDPTSLILPYTRAVDPASPRDHRWILASLTKKANAWVDKQTFDWRVDRFGRPFDGQPSLPDERAVFDAYAERWGVLSPPYHLSGSGWYRARYVFAAAAGAVLLSGATDADALGLAYQVTPAEVERLSDAGLRELAAWQSATLWPLLPLDERETLHQVESAIRLATERVR